MKWCVLIVVLMSPLGLYAQQSCLSDGDASSTNTIVMPNKARTDLYRGQQAFSVSMLEAIRKATPHENIFFSPYSTYHALLLAYFGARGDTEKELVSTMRLDWAKNRDEVRNGYRLEKQSRVLRSKSMPLEFASADKIFFDNNIKLTPCAKDVLIDELESKDFVHQPEKCRNDINEWISNITHKEINEMLGEGDINEQTQMVLANAAYFKGQWSHKFDPADTTQDIFYTTPSNYSFVPMMHQRGTYNLAVDDRLGAYVLEMPYLTSNNEKDESQISMIIFLPPFEEGSLERVLSRLNPDSLEMALKDAMPREIDISLPKFEFEQKLELLPILNKMGINSIFESKADFSGFSTENRISFGDAKHVAKIKVDEEGSTAAAATVLFSFRSARPVEPTQFECKHPFMFLIYDHKAKAVLFTGIYRNPKST